MLKSIKNVWKITEVRKRILFTAFIIFIYRLGSHIPTPGIDSAKLAAMFNKGSGVLGFLDMFAGGALKRFSIFALGIAPYINASIIMQLLVYVIPSLEKLSKEGESGRKKISQYTRYGTVIIGALQAFGMSFMLRNAGVVSSDFNFIVFTLVVIITLTAGTSFVMWLGEKVTERGIGNGISLLIFAGIVAGLPSALYSEFATRGDELLFLPKMLILAFVALIVIAFIVFMQEGQRRIPVQYAKRVVGRKVYGGTSTYIPLRVNQAGVIPIIFAVSLMLFPTMISQFFMGRLATGSAMRPFFKGVLTYFSTGHPFYYVCYCGLIIFFCYFYTAITFNPKDLADNMKKSGGFIPGVRAGRPTADYIDRVLTRITLAGSVFLALIALMPTIFMAMAKVQYSFGGTGLLIVVGVALDTMKQLESHLVTRKYDGFMKKKGTFLR